MKRKFFNPELYLRPQELGYFGFIYLIRNTINNKVYIGQTQKSVSRRFYSHCTRAGKENFTLDIIYKAKTREELDLKEAEYIKTYNSTDSSIGYNICLGGNDIHLNPERELYRIERVKEGINKSTKRINSINALLNHTSSIKGKKKSPEECYLIALSSKNRKIVKAINRSTGGIIFFESVRTAGEYFGNYMMVSGVCRGVKPSYKNHIMRFVNQHGN